eukprot:CAMPEP_0175059780 /NCGR_PEP_ID=MMETSP0052_2-20121109/12623_1 /TAXON_ID=51329 ORGANISM="Polytomella parva, Strain SAG 63-3" /NCGR_SAMPLE_ID=MMETSP0052_2 /ASSEMBLY_ACC=CAM_ASM_000194 /LENGTH=481 /DNA_ID=CAMNT_0016325369 /DNA_START=183 /DNA_END=1625 /DNA_ORIENTATION=-
MDMDLIEHQELMYLVIEYLSNRSLPFLAPDFKKYALSHNLLPSRLDIYGQSHSDDIFILERSRRHFPKDSLVCLLSHLLTSTKDKKPQPSYISDVFFGFSRPSFPVSPLQEGLGMLHVLNSLSNSVSSDPHFLSFVARLNGPSVFRTTYLDEVGISNNDTFITVGKPNYEGIEQMSNYNRPSFSGALQQFQHHGTFRGHRSAVYCCCMNGKGSLVFTGSDDWLVKIWCAYTGALLRSCRGHGSEITDFAVSCDDSLLASGCNDQTIRIWSLKSSTLGHPIALLLGHTASVTYLDFHPKIPFALLSCSSDGSLRIWNADSNKRNNKDMSHADNGRTNNNDNSNNNNDNNDHKNLVLDDNDLDNGTNADEVIDLTSSYPPSSLSSTATLNSTPTIVLHQGRCFDNALELTRTAIRNRDPFSASSRSGDPPSSNRPTQRDLPRDPPRHVSFALDLVDSTSLSGFESGSGLRSGPEFRSDFGVSG